ncbi:MAG: aminoacyl-tRNA hydrolase [Bacilli bacterium]
MKLIIGLGNPGSLYINTRHNTGFIILDNYASCNNFLIDKKKFDGLYQIVLVNNEQVIFLKPQTFMNCSGECIIKFINYFKISIDNILVVYDDLDIEIGKYKLRDNGRSGGHNGISNIIIHVCTQKFKRLKVGISNDKNIATKNYVLGKFTLEQQKKLHCVINTSCDIINDFISLSFDQLMNKYNKR